MKIRWVISLFTITFAVTLAVVAGQRLSTETMAVVVGVVAGVAASIPTSLIVIWVARVVLTAPDRNRTAPETSAEPPDRETKIIIVPAPAANYPTGNAYLPFNAPLTSYAPAAQPRQFTIIGSETTPEDNVSPWR